MERVLKTAPVNTALKLTDLKDYLRLEVDDLEVEDSYLNFLISTAQDWVEKETNNLLITQTWNLYLNDFPKTNYIELPLVPLQSVSSIKYTDSSGTVNTWASSNYIVDTISYTPKIILAYQVDWPSTDLYPSNPIDIEAVFGYGLTSSTIKAPLRQAMLLLCSHWYDNREVVHLKDEPFEIPMMVDTLLSKYKRHRI